jgi:hypothetical protein
MRGGIPGDGGVDRRIKRRALTNLAIERRAETGVDE